MPGPSGAAGKGLEINDDLKRYFSVEVVSQYSDYLSSPIVSKTYKLGYRKCTIDDNYSVQQKEIFTVATTAAGYIIYCLEEPTGDIKLIRNFNSLKQQDV